MSRNPYSPPGATVADPPTPPIKKPPLVARALHWRVSFDSRNWVDFLGVAAEVVALCLLFSRPANAWFRVKPGA